MLNKRKGSPLFPKFEEFAARNDLMRTLKGNSQVKLHRILGRGQTKADGLDLPPAKIERKMELVSLKLPPNMEVPDGVKTEIEKAKEELEKELKGLKKSEGVRRLGPAGAPAAFGPFRV